MARVETGGQAGVDDFVVMDGRGFAGEHDHGQASQVAHRQPLALPRLRPMARQGDAHRFLAYAGAQEARVERRAPGSQADIDLALLEQVQQLTGPERLDVDFQLRRLLAQRPDGGGELRHGAVSRHDAEADAAGHAVRGNLELFAERQRARQYVARERLQFLPGPGRYDAAGQAHQQPGAELVFQRGDVARQGGLGDVQVARGRGNAARVAYLQKVP